MNIKSWVRTSILSAVAIVSALTAPSARAQTGGTVVSSCGSASYSAGQYGSSTVDTLGNLCTSQSGGGAPAQVTAVTPTDRGGTITSGGAAQNAMASNASRKGGWIQNPCSATEDLYVSTSTTATVGGAGNDADLAPCGSYGLTQNGLIITAAVSVVAATTSHRWLGKETQ